jgi:hypothetical protein
MPTDVASSTIRGNITTRARWFLRSFGNNGYFPTTKISGAPDRHGDESAVPWQRSGIVARFTKQNWARVIPFAPGHAGASYMWNDQTSQVNRRGGVHTVTIVSTDMPGPSNRGF